MPLWKCFDQFLIILHYFGGHSLIFNHLSNFRNVYINFQFLYAIWKMYSQISSCLMSFWECIHWFSIPLCYLGNVFTNFSLFLQMLKPYFSLCCYYWALSLLSNESHYLNMFSFICFPLFVWCWFITVAMSTFSQIN